MSLCSPGTMFNPIHAVCDWPINVLKVRPECGDTYFLPVPVTEIGISEDDNKENADVISSPNNSSRDNVLIVPTSRTPLPLCNSEK